MAQAHPSGRNQINLRCLTRHQNYEPDGNPFQDSNVRFDPVGGQQAWPGILKSHADQRTFVALLFILQRLNHRPGGVEEELRYGAHRSVFQVHNAQLPGWNR